MEAIDQTLLLIQAMHKSNIVKLRAIHLLWGVVGIALSVGMTSTEMDGWYCDKCNSRHFYHDLMHRCERCRLDFCVSCQGLRGPDHAYAPIVNPMQQKLNDVPSSTSSFTRTPHSSALGGQIVTNPLHISAHHSHAAAPLTISLGSSSSSSSSSMLGIRPSKYYS